MARFHQWLSQLVRRTPGPAARHVGLAPAARHVGLAPAVWSVATPADPTQPLWLVPAYQRQRRSGDRPGLR